MKRYPLLFVALTLFISCSCHAQKVTVDPNVGQTAQPVDLSASDSRLTQKVTYEAWHTPLKTILADLSESTGVTLNSGYSKQDWQVRDRKMNVCVKDVTLAQLMNSISRVMMFKWSCSDDAKPSYRLVADRRLLSKLQAEARKRERELHAEEVRRRASLVEEFAKVADTSGADLELLKKENPYLGLCASTGFAKMLTAMFSEQPKLREMFVNAERMTVIPSTEFSKETLKLCVDVMRYGQEHFADSEALPENPEERLAKNRIHFEIIPKPYEWGVRRRLIYFGWINAALSEGITPAIRTVGHLRYPEAKSTKSAAANRLSVENQPLESQTDWHKFKSDENKGIHEDEKFIEWYLMFDPVLEHPDEADLHKEVKVELTEEAQKSMMETLKVIGGRSYPRLVYQAALEAIAEASKMSIISDSYSVLLGSVSSPGKGELRAILDEFTETYRCNWEKHGSIVEVRRRDWFRRRSCQLPDEWMKAWREQIEKNGCFDLDTCIRISALPDDQMEENIRVDPLLNEAIGISWEVDFHKIFCRFYVQLTPSQRAQVFSEDGFELRELTPDQLPAYREMFVGGWHPMWGQEALGDPVGTQATLSVTSRIAVENGVQCYDFHVGGTGEDDKELYHGWSIPLRKIVRPQDAQKPK